MKTIIAILLASMLQGCAVFTASPSLPAYLSAHAAGVTTVATVGTVAATWESVYLNSKAIIAGWLTPKEPTK